MLADYALGLLAVGEMYAHPIKLAGIFVAFAIWVKFTEWVDKDSVRVNTYTMIWNFSTLGAGIVAFSCALFVPNFLIGYLVCWVVLLGVMVPYIVHRNGLVEAPDTVFTVHHVRRLQKGGGQGGSVVEVNERVALKGPGGKIRVSEDEEERIQYSLVQDLFFEFLLRRVGLVEMALGPEEATIQYEIDGVKIPRESLSREDGERVIQFLKEALGHDIEERRKPQRGKLTAKTEDQSFELRITTAGTTAGETVRIRVVGPEATFKIDDLGFTAKQRERVQEVLDAERGLVIFSGPAGSGLTTTIYSVTRSHDAFLLNIQMLEYEAELEIANVTQKRYSGQDNKTFTDELQRIIRSDPDVLVLPELREATAAPIIAKAAIQKQKIYTCLPAVESAEAIRKWAKLVNDPKMLTDALVAVFNQRLVRKLCEVCKEGYKPDAALLQKLNLPKDAVLYRVPEPEYDKQGNPIPCSACEGVGYVGRTAVFDVVLVDDALRNIIQRGGNTADIQTYLAKAGAGLQKFALDKVLDGTTSIQEVVRVIRGEARRKAG